MPAQQKQGAGGAGHVGGEVAVYVAAQGQGGGQTGQTQGVDGVPGTGPQAVGPQVVPRYVIAQIAPDEGNVQLLEPVVGPRAGEKGEQGGEQQPRQEPEGQQPLQLPSGAAPDQSPEDGGEQVQTQQHVEIPQVILRLPPQSEQQGVPHARRPGVAKVNEIVEKTPGQQGGEDAGQTAPEQEANGQRLIRVQQESARQQDEDRHAPAGQPVPGHQRRPLRRALLRQGQPGGGGVEQDHGKGGQDPQQVGPGQTSRSPGRGALQQGIHGENLLWVR